MKNNLADQSRPRIPFGRPTLVGRELEYIMEAVAGGTIAGGGVFTQRCEKTLEAQLPAKKVMLVHSCTAALEIAAILADVGPGDEVIMPSFTFSSTATAFVLRGATPVFVDISPVNLNIDINKILPAVTSKTKAIVPVHYAGVACDLDEICEIADMKNIIVIEDAAQAHYSTYKGRALGSIGHLGCISFHETKNVISGEGGALIINEDRFLTRSEIIRDKGTDRNQFLLGHVDKYTWKDIGSSYAPSELVSAFLLAQLEHAEEICARRRWSYDLYRTLLSPLSALGIIQIPQAAGRESNGHIFWFLVEDMNVRTRLLKFLNDHGVNAVFHYVPLHSAPAGRRFGRCGSDLAITDRVSACLIRLPMHLNMADTDIMYVSDTVTKFFFGQRT